MVVVIIGLAITGLLVINTDTVTADRIGTSVTDNNSESLHDVPTLGTSMTVLPSLLRLFSALIIVIGCIYGGIYLLKRVMNRRFHGNGSFHALEVLETTHIGPKKMVSLVRVGNKAVLVGMTETTISPLAELDTEQTHEILSQQQATIPEHDFKKVLKSATGRFRTVRLKRHQAALDT